MSGIIHIMLLICNHLLHLWGLKTSHLKAILHNWKQKVIALYQIWAIAAEGK
jgi:hypothetical protein